MDIQKVLASIAIILIAVGVLILGGGIHFWQKSKTSTPAQTACTMDAKICPDGSYVGRTGPNCEFKACPIANSTATSTPLCSKEENCCTKNEDCVKPSIWFRNCNTQEYISKILKEVIEKGNMPGEVPLKENTTCTCENNKCVTHN